MTLDTRSSISIQPLLDSLSLERIVRNESSSFTTTKRNKMNLSGGQPGGARRRRHLPVCCYLTLVGISLILAASLVQPSDAAALNPVGTKTRTNKDRGCYYMLQHYKNGEQIKTDEPCLNCTCENSMLMCYLRVCPYVKPMGDRCIVERVPGECCPKITCSDVTPPVDGLEQQVEPETVAPPASETIGSNGTTVNNFDIALTNASEVGTGANGCTLDGNYYHEGALLPTDPKKPCEICYCINGSSACVLQECALEVSGCAPVYQAGGCCPTRYNCTTSATGQRRASPAANRRKFWENFTGSGSSSTTKLPASHEVLSFSTSTTAKPMIFPNFGRDSEKPTVSGCRAANSTKVYTDGERVPSKNKCEHCYCMRNEIVCAVQECKPPCDGCTPIYEDDKDCCPKRYECVAPTQRVPTDNIIDAQPETTTPLSPIEQPALPGIISASVNLEITPEPKPASAGENPTSTSAPQESSSEAQKDPQPPLLDGSTPVPLPTSMDPAKTEISVMTTRQTNAPLRPISPKLSGEDEGPTEPMSSDQESTNASKPESRESTNVDGFSLNGEREQETDLSKSAGRFVAPEGSMIPYANQGQDANEVIPPALTSTIAPPTTIRDVSDATNESGSAKSVEVQNSEKKMRPQVIPSIIPGEGSCRYNGRLYSNGQEVKSKDNCMEICMCINSVVYCDEVDCPKGPANQDNCKRVVVEGECCPKYVCDEAEETTPTKTEPTGVIAPSAAPQQPTDQATGQTVSSNSPAIQPSESTQGPAETTSTEGPNPTTIETLIIKDEATSETIPSSQPTTNPVASTVSGDTVSKVEVTTKPEQASTGNELAQPTEPATSTTTTTTAAPSSPQTQATNVETSDAASAREGQPELATTTTTMSVPEASSTTQSSIDTEFKDVKVADVMAPSLLPEIKETTTTTLPEAKEKATSISGQASTSEVKPTVDVQPDAPLSHKQADEATTRAQEPTTASSLVPVSETTESQTTRVRVDSEPKVASDTANLSPELNTITSSESATTLPVSEATSTVAPVSEAASPAVVTAVPSASTTTEASSSSTAAAAVEQTTKFIEDLVKAAEIPSTGSETSPQPTVAAETTTSSPVEKFTPQEVSETSGSSSPPATDASARSEDVNSTTSAEATTKAADQETTKVTEPQPSTPESTPSAAVVIETTTPAAVPSEKSVEQTGATITTSAAPETKLETETPAKSNTISTTENTGPTDVTSVKVNDLPISAESVTTVTQPQSTDASPSSPQAQLEILSMPTTTNQTLGENLVATNVAREGGAEPAQTTPSIEATSTISSSSTSESSTYANAGDMASSSPMPESTDLATSTSPIQDRPQGAVSSTPEAPLTTGATSAVEVPSDTTLAPKQAEAATPAIDQITSPAPSKATTDFGSVSLSESTPGAPVDTQPKTKVESVELSPELNTITGSDSATSSAPADVTSSSAVPTSESTIKPEQAPTSYDLAQPTESATTTTTTTTTTASSSPETQTTPEAGTAREGQPESALPTTTTITDAPSASQTQATSADNSEAASAREGQPEPALPTTTMSVSDTPSTTQSSTSNEIKDADVVGVIASTTTPETRETAPPTATAPSSLPEGQDKSLSGSMEQPSSNGVKPTSEVLPETSLSPKQAEDATTRAQDSTTGSSTTETTTALSSVSDPVSTLAPQEKVITDTVNVSPTTPVIDQTTRSETTDSSSISPSEPTPVPTSSAPIDTEPKVVVELAHPSPDLNTITSGDSATTLSSSEATSIAAPVREATSPAAMTDAPSTTTMTAAAAAEQTTKPVDETAKEAEVSSSSTYQPQPPVVAETTTATPVDGTSGQSVTSGNEVLSASSIQPDIDASARSEGVGTSTSAEPATKLVDSETTKPIELQYSSTSESIPSTAAVTETTTTSTVSSEKSVERTESQTTTSSTSSVQAETEAPPKSDLASTVTGTETQDTSAPKVNDPVTISPEMTTTTSELPSTDASSSSSQAQREVVSMPTTTNLTLGENLVSTNVAREGESEPSQPIPSVETTSTISPEGNTLVNAGDSASSSPQPEVKDLTTQSSPPSVDFVSSVSSDTTPTAKSAADVSPDTTPAPKHVEAVTSAIDQTTSPAQPEAATDLSSVSLSESTPSSTSDAPVDTEPKVANDAVNPSPELNTITNSESVTTSAPVDASSSSSAAPVSEPTIKPEQAPTSYDPAQPTDSATSTTTTISTTTTAPSSSQTSADNSETASAREGQPELVLPTTTMSVSDSSSTTQSSNVKSADNMTEGEVSTSPIPESKETLAPTTSTSTLPLEALVKATSISPEQANTSEVKQAGESSSEAPLDPKQTEETTTRVQDSTTGQPSTKPTTASSSTTDLVSNPQEKGVTYTANLSPELNTITSSESATTLPVSEATSTVAPVSEAASPAVVTAVPSASTTTEASSSSTAAAAVEQTTKFIEDLVKAAEIPSTGSETSPQPTVAAETTTSSPVEKFTPQEVSETSGSSSPPATDASARSEDVNSTTSAEATTKAADQETTKVTEPQPSTPESTPSAAVVIETTTPAAVPSEKSVELTESQTTASVASSAQPNTEMSASSTEAESTTTVTPKPETTSAAQEQSPSINQETKSAFVPTSTERPVDLTGSLIEVARADPNFDTSTEMPPELKATPSPADEFIAGISTNGSSFKPVEITTVLPSIRGQSTPITIPWSHIANISQPETTTASIPAEQHATSGFNNFTQGVKSISHEPTQSSVGVSESDYEELSEEPGCEYEGKTYNSAQQIPRSHPCDFCFCFRGDIICLQQTCPPPVPHCFESVMDGFCCPRYECPVHTVRSSPNSTSLSLTPFESHSQLQAPSDPQSSEPRQLVPPVARGSNVKGCFVDNKLYGVGQNIISASGPCLDCKCDKSGMMKCNPKECTPENPLLQQINREVLQSTLSRSQVR